MPPLEARLARNEVMFRAINERIRELAGRFEHAASDAGTLSFVCECSDETCVDRIELTLEQYDDVRAIPVRFVVRPGHEATPLVERVVYRSEHFVIVRKVGLAADVVREMSGSDG
jgi:hypothetical protein